MGRFSTLSGRLWPGRSKPMTSSPTSRAFAGSSAGSRPFRCERGSNVRSSTTGHTQTRERRPDSCRVSVPRLHGRRGKRRWSTTSCAIFRHGSSRTSAAFTNRVQSARRSAAPVFRSPFLGSILDSGGRGTCCESSSISNCPTDDRPHLLAHRQPLRSTLGAACRRAHRDWH